MPQTFLQPGQTLLALLRFSARSKADKLIQNGGLNLYPDPYVNASYTTQELNLALNTSMGEYADVLATEFGNIARRIASASTRIARALRSRASRRWSR